MKPIKQTKQNIIIIDTANIIYRIIHTFPGIVMKYDDKSYFNTGAIYGFIRIIISLYEKYKPKNILIVFEGNKNNNPRFKDANYKSKRVNNKTIDITNEMLLLKDIIVMMGMICIIPQQGECDDGIANVVQKLKSKYNIYIVSNDHDMNVLLDNNVSILRKIKDDSDYNKLITKQSFILEKGFDPKYFSLLLAISGDTSDNIPGIAGFGAVRAERVIKNLLDNKIPINIDNISIEVNKIKKNLILDIDDIKKQLIRYYNLTTIRTDWPIVAAISKENEINTERLLRMFEYMQFRTFINQFENIIKMCNKFNIYKHNITQQLK